MTTHADGSQSTAGTGGPDSKAETGTPTLIPQAALRILCQRTGGTISAATFYRWVRCGSIPSIRLGARIFIPRPAMEEFIQKCFEVD